MKKKIMKEQEIVNYINNLKEPVVRATLRKELGIDAYRLNNIIERNNLQNKVVHKKELTKYKYTPIINYIKENAPIESLYPLVDKFGISYENLRHIIRDNNLERYIYYMKWKEYNNEK